MSWERYKLGDLYAVHNGLSKGRKYFGSGYGFLSFSTVFNNYFIPDELSDFVRSTEKEQKNYSIRRGDVFVTRTSETSDELGMSCVALKNYPHATYNGFTKRLRPTTDKVLPEYIGYYMRMPSFRRKFMAFSTMTTRASLKNEDLLGLEVELPNYDKQTSIANVLMTYDDLIENNQKQIKLLEEVAQRLYKEWFVDLHFPGYEEAEIIDGLPKGWEIKKVDELLQKVQKKVKVKASEYMSEEKIPIVDQSRKFIAGYTNNQESLSDELPAIIFGDHTRIIKYIQFPYARGADGTQVIISNTSRMPQALFYCALKNIDLSNHHYARHFKYLKEKNVLLPERTISGKFNDIADVYFTNIMSLRKMNARLSEARDRLLPKLMSGEIEV